MGSMYLMFERSYKFSEVAIKQKENICNSRLDVEVGSEILPGIQRPIPLIAANMSTVVNADFCIKLYELGALGIMHRAFPDNENYVKEVKKIAEQCPVVAASIGINDNDFWLVEQLIKLGGANVLCVDVAHGFNKKSLKMCQHIRHFHPQVKIIAGNTINPDMLKMFGNYIDAIKVGIGGGNSCSTAETAGCTKNQFSAVYDFREVQKHGIKIISDGGIRLPSDFTKAIGAGASAVMAGSIFARCPESAAKTIEIDGVPKKLLAGMASTYVQEKWKGGVKPGTCSEGKVVYLDMGEPVEKLLQRYIGALRTGISYAGFNNVSDFQQGCEFIGI